MKIRQWNASRNWFLASLLVALGCWATLAQDWPQWRGPRRDGVIPAFQPPTKWPATLKRLWELKVGAGYSSPVAANGRIFLHSRNGDREVVSAFDWKSGKTLWQDRYLSPSGKTKQYADSEGEGPYATPAIDGGELYTLGINAVLSCYDAMSGELKWRRDYARDLASKTRFCGTAASPLVEDGLVIFYVGDDDKGRLIALDKKTGRDRWQWAEAGAAYASPIVAEIEGVRQLIVLTDQSAAGIAPATGALLWSLPVPSSRAGCSQNIPTPVAPGGNIIILSHAKGTEALKLARAGQQWEIEQVWKNPRLLMNLSSPVTDGRYLFGLSTQRKGQYFCLDARSGEIAWISEGREGDIASTLLAGNYLFFLSDAGILSIATKRADKFETAAKYTVAESKVWANPVIGDRGILVRADSTLTLWGFE